MGFFLQFNSKHFFPSHVLLHSNSSWVARAESSRRAELLPRGELSARGEAPPPALSRATHLMQVGGHTATTVEMEEALTHSPTRSGAQARGAASIQTIVNASERISEIASTKQHAATQGVVYGRQQV